ncbi:MAG TPA: RagB/SusD family nutrient uptake outer membrane protein, partial [Bacteroidales bacterium]|nr:RagB/SusD family nutrient uptake outer membrane protein [Bacteroidales bacterium]
MKKYIISLIIVLLLAPSCSESFFDKYPTDSMTVENYMKTTSEIQTVLYAAYAATRGNFANSIVYIGDLPTDNAYDYKLNNSAAHIALHESTVDSQNGVISGLWYSCYQIINRCCLVLESIERINTTPEVYNQIVGEAKFLRAYAYYVMVRVWGDVPLVLEDIKDYMKVFEYGRTPVNVVYDQIIDDLEDAEAKLPDFYTRDADKGKATATAAQAILGDVYLTRGEHATAKTYFEKIIAKEGANLGLLNDYASIFVQSNANNKEIIFAIQYSHNQTPAVSNYLGSASLGNIQGIPISPSGIPSQIYGVNVLMMTHELEAKFSATDRRRSVIYTDLVSPDYGC